MKVIRAITGLPVTERVAPFRRARQTGIVVAALVVGVLLMAGCGGGSPSSGVAHLGSRTSSDSSSSDAGGASSSAPAQAASQGVAYGACIRAHGVPDFPDPQVSATGNSVSVKVRVTSGITGNPHFKSAQQACRKLLPGGGPGSGAGGQLSTREQGEVLKLVACIRAHGVPNLPDPSFADGGVHLPQSVDVRSAAFKAAEQACQSLIPPSLRGGS
jgi:hypothetical protein